MSRWRDQKKEGGAGVEPAYADLQSATSPLGYPPKWVMQDNMAHQFLTFCRPMSGNLF